MPESGPIARIRATLRRLLQNSTVRGVALIGGGTALGQALNVIATPIVSRMYSPHAYGALAVYSSILSIAACAVSFRFEIAIPLTREDEEARDLLVLALSLAVLTSALTGIGLLIWRALAQAHHGDPLFWTLVWTVPLGMVGLGFYESLDYWAIRKRLYKTMSATRLSQATASVGTQLALWRLPPRGLGLVLAAIVAQAFGLRTLFTAFWRSRPQAPLPSLAKLAATARRFFKTGAFGTASALVGNFGDALPSLILARAYGLEAAGIYLMAARLLALPTRLVGAATADVFSAEASERLRKDPRLVLGYFESVHRHLLKIGVGLMALGALSPWVLPWVLGGKWHDAGMTALILAPMAATDITVRPLYNITIIGNRSNLQLATSFILTCLSVLGLGVPILAGQGPRVTLLSFSLCRCLGCWLIYFIYHWVAKNIATGTPREAAGG